MSLSYGNKMMNNGLIFNLDMANKKSNPDGVQIKDISTNARTCSFFGTGTVLSGGVDGGVYLSGAGRVNTDLTDIGTSYTFEVWAKKESAYSTYNMIFGFSLPYGNINVDNKVHYSVYISGVQRSIYSSNILTLGTWHHLTYQTEYDGVNTTMRVFHNAVLVGTNQFVGSPSTPSYPMCIGNYVPSGVGHPFNGSVGVLRVYNRSITQEEITHNFNATRNRYGV